MTLTTVTTVDSPVASRKCCSWHIPLGMFILAAALQVVAWYCYWDDFTNSLISILYIWPATCCGWLIWWTFFSGLSWSWRLGGWGVLIAVGVLLSAMIRIDGTDGAMLPRWSFRWQPTPEDVARAKWSQPAGSPTADSEMLSLSQEDSRLPDGVVTEEPSVSVPDPDDSVDYRGNLRDGIIRGRGFRKDWDHRPPQLLWKQHVGLAWSSFAVQGEHAVTQEQRDEEECVACYNLNTGELIWLHRDRARFRQTAVMGGDGPRATPVIVGDKVYALGATGILNCLDLRKGQLIWQRNILDDAGEANKPAENLPWGMSGSPLIVDDWLIVVPGGGAGKSTIAYNRLTGEIRWTAGNYPASYAAPRLESLCDTAIVLVFHGIGLTGHELTTGRELWSVSWENNPRVNAAQPIKLMEDTLFFASGYGLGGARLVLKKGDTNELWTYQISWKTPRMKLKFNDAVYHRGMIYGLDDGRNLTCMDAETGVVRWRGSRYGYGQLLLHEDTLLILSEDGELVLVAADPQVFQERHRLSALEGTTWNHPVVAQGKILIRNATQAMCFDASP